MKRRAELKLKLTGASVFDTGKRAFIKRDVYVSDGVICGALSEYENIDCAEKFIVPGYVDVHTHGCGGVDIMEADAKALEKLSLIYASHGTTTVFPTVMTAALPKINSAISNIKSTVTGGARFAGVHIEGPYISAKKPGCHDVSLIRKPDAGEMTALAEKIYPLKTHFTVAPEEAPEGLIRKLSEASTIGIGHTNATAEECEKALSDGAVSFTHTFNAMTALTHRGTGAAGAAMASSAYAELICDGLHVSPEAVRALYKAKKYDGDKLVLITDSIPQATLPFGNYEMNGIPFTLSEGGAKKADGTIVGSTLTLHDAIKNLMRFCDIAFEEALICATKTPAEMTGIYGDCGSIEIGKRADMLVLDKEKNISSVIIGGKKII